MRLGDTSDTYFGYIFVHLLLTHTRHIHVHVYFGYVRPGRVQCDFRVIQGICLKMKFEIQNEIWDSWMLLTHILWGRCDHVGFKVNLESFVAPVFQNGL